MKKVVKIIFGSIAGIIGLAELFHGGFTSFFFMATIICLLIPNISEKIQTIITPWKNRWMRYGIIGVLFIIGVFSIQGGGEEYALEKKEDLLIDYIKNTRTDKSLNNIRLLAETGELFNNVNYSLVHPHDGYLTSTKDSASGNVTYTFNPRINFDEIITEQYLGELSEGRITSYKLRFIVNAKDSIISKRTFISYSKQGLKAYNNDSVPELRNSLKEDKIARRREQFTMEREREQREYKRQQLKEEFYERCLHPYDGSHRKLEALVKRNMNDPDSYEHDETIVTLKLDHAIVFMTYRGRNGFGGIVRESIKATVSLEDCSVISILE